MPSESSVELHGSMDTDIAWLMRELELLDNDADVLLEGRVRNWFEETERDALQSLDEGVDFSSLKLASDALRGQDRKVRLLAWLSQSLHHSTDMFQNDVLRHVFHHGLRKLPDEILADICEVVCDATGSAKKYAIALCNFQLVCQRFRDVALNRARLWSSVQDDMPAERLELQVRRCSATIGMSFQITYPKDWVKRDNGHCLCKQWGAIKKYRHRWTRGIIRLGCSPPAADHLCTEQLQDLHLPLLSMIKIQITDQHVALNLLSSWDFPLLEHLQCEEGSEFNLRLAHPIKQLELSPVVVNIGDLLHLFRSPAVASLSKLALKFRLSYFLDMDNIFVNANARIILSCVQKLTVMIDGTINIDTFQFLQLLVVPNVKHVSIQVDVGQTSLPAFYDWLKVLGRGVARGIASVAVSLPQAGGLRSQEINTRASDCFVLRDGVESGSAESGADIAIHVFDPESEAL